MMRQVDAARRRFGEDSGLIYDESEVSSTSSHRQWQFRCKGSYQRVKLRNLGNTGASPMKEMLIRKICQHVKELEPDFLAGIDWPIMKSLWDYLSERNLVSPHVWKVFALAYPEEPCLKHHRFNAAMFVQAGTWDNSLRFVSSPALEFVTFLDISNLKMSRMDLLMLPELETLGTLTVGPAISVTASDGSVQDGVDDAILRSWARSAEERGQMSCLRSLRVREQTELTGECLSFVTAIPNVASFTIEGVSDVLDFVDPDLAGLLGWEIGDAFEEGGEIDEVTAAANSKELWWLPAYDTFISNSAPHAQQVGEKEAAALNDVPMLHLDLAGPDMGGWRKSEETERFCYRRAHTSGPIAQSLWTKESKKRTAVPETRKAKQIRTVQDAAQSLAEFGV